MDRTKEMTLYAALDLSVGNKAATSVKEDHLVVVQRLMNFRTGEFNWHYWIIRNGKSAGTTIYDASYHLGEMLQKSYGIDYMEDKVWMPVEWMDR